MRFHTLMIAPLFMVAACAPPATGNQEEITQPARSVVVQRVEPQPLEVTIKLPVTIRPRDVIELRAPVAGTLRHMKYEKGDVVPVSKLPEAGWLEAEEFLTTVEPDAAPSDEQMALRNLRHLQGFESFARIEAAQLMEGFWEAQVSYDQAVRDLKRTEEYAQSTGAQLDQARTRRSAARAGVSRMLAMIHDTYICNPVEGVLINKHRHEGEYVNMGELIGEVAVMHTLVAELEIPEAQRSAIEVGQEIDIRIGALTDDDGEPLVRKGRVALIDSVAHPTTHSFTVELHIENPDRSLPAGMFGTVYVVIYRNAEALVVPLSTLKLAGPRKSLFLVEGEGEGAIVRELANVQIGHMTLDWVEIRGDTLKPGARVVTFGAQSLGDGDRIKYTENDPYVVKGSDQ